MSILVALGTAMTALTWKHVTDSTVHETSEQRTLRIESVIAAKTPPPQVRLQLDRIEQDLKELKVTVDKLRRP